MGQNLIWNYSRKTKIGLDMATFWSYLILPIRAVSGWYIRTYDDGGREIDVTPCVITTYNYFEIILE